MSTRWGITKWLFKMAFLRAGNRTSNLVSQRLSADWLWVRSWEARPNYRTHWRLTAANTVWTNEDQNLGNQLASDDTLRERLPQEWLIRRCSKPLTRQAPVHLLFDLMLKYLDEDRCCSDPTLPHKLSWRCLCPRCKETPALRRLVPQVPRFSSRVTLSNWCSEIKSGDTSHSVWWTRADNKLDAHRLRRQSAANVKTNQDLVAWARNIHVDTDSRQSKLSPELVHQLITYAQTQHFNEGGNFRPIPKIRVYCTTLVDNDVHGKRYCLSLTTSGARIIFPRCRRSTSAGFLAFHS